MIGDLPAGHAPEPWATEDGHLVLAAVHGCHIFVAAIEVAAERATIHHVETMAPLGRHAVRCVDGDRLWVAGDRQVLQLDWRTGEVVRWESLSPFVAERALVEHLYFFPGARSLWIESSDYAQREFALRVVDLERWAVVRTVNAGRFLVSIPGDEPLLGALDLDAGAVLYAGRGGSVGEIAELRGQRIAAIVRHPDRAGFVLAASPPDEEAEVSLYDVVPGRPLHPLVIQNSDPDATIWLQSVRGRGLVFVYAATATGPEVTVISTRPEGLNPTVRVPAPREIAFAHDPTSGRGYVVWESNRGVHASELGERAPDFGEIREPRPFPAVAPHFYCAPSDAAVFEGIDELLRAGQWGDARARLEQIHADALSPPHREHYHHLLGLVFARLGDPAEACAIWEQGCSHGDGDDRFLSCHLESCLEIVEPLGDRSSAEGAHEIAQVRWAIANAAACQSRRDDVGALAALRTRAVYRARERQSLARLAAAWLALPEVSGNDGAWFDQAQALAQFLSVAETYERDLPIPGAWNDARIAEIATRARAWFDGERRAT